jgi:hypothetical protein
VTRRSVVARIALRIGMRRLGLVVAALSLSASTSGSASSKALSGASTYTAAASTVLLDVHVVDVVTGKVAHNQAIVVRDGVIVRIAPMASIALPAGATVHDLAGVYVIPGLWDTRVHLDRTGRSSLALFLANGVTGVRDIGSKRAGLGAWTDSLRTGALQGPKVVWADNRAEGILSSAKTLEHRFLSPHDGLLTRRRALRMLADTGAGRDPRVGYVDLALQRAWQRAFSAPGVDPAHGSRGDIEATSLHELRWTASSTVMLLAGTDAGAPLAFPGFSLADELEAMVKEGGLTPLQSLQTATINVAHWAKSDDRSGTVAVGRMADLVLLARNPLETIGNVRRIRGVMRAGRMFDRAAIDSMLESAKRQP